MRPRKKTYKKKLYQVDWFTQGGWNYRTTMECDWDAVRRFKKLARLFGETIEYKAYYRECLY